MNFVVMSLSIAAAYELHVPWVVGVADCIDDRCLHHRFVNVTNRFDMDHSAQNELQALAARSAPTAHAANRDRAKNVDVRWRKYNFVRRVRKDVSHQAAADGGSTFVGQPAGGGSASLTRLDPAKGSVALAAVPAEGASKSSVAVEPAGAPGRSALVLEPRKEDSKSRAGAGPSDAEAKSASRLEPASGAENPASRLGSVLEGAASLVQPPNQPQLQPLQGPSNNNLNSAVEPRPPSISAVSPAKDATAGAKVPSTHELTAIHLDSVAAAAHVPQVLPAANQLEGQQNSIDLPASETSKTNKIVSAAKSALDPVTLINGEQADDTKKLGAGKISSNSKTFQSDLELRPLAVVTKDSAESTTTQTSNSTEEQTPETELAEGLAPPHSSPAVTHVSPAPNQPVFSNVLGTSSNDSRMSPNADANSTHLAHATNTSSRESHSSESNESTSSSEEHAAALKPKAVDTANISTLKLPAPTNISGKNPAVLDECTPLLSASVIKTQVGDVIEATYEKDPNTMDAVRLHHNSGYTKNITATPHLQHILAPPNRENLAPVCVNFSCSVHQLLFTNAMHALNLTRPETPAADTGHPHQPSSLNELLSDKKTIDPGQNRAFSGGIVSYYPLVVIPWVLVPKYPIQTALRGRLATFQYDDPNTAALVILTKNESIASTAPKNSNLSPTFLVKKQESGKLHYSHLVQLVAPPMFYTGESFAFLPTNKNIEQDSAEKNSAHQ